MAGWFGPSSREEQLEAKGAELPQTLDQADLGGQSVEQAGWRPAGRFEDLEVIRMKAGMSNREALPALRHARAHLAPLAGQGPHRGTEIQTQDSLAATMAETATTTTVQTPSGESPRPTLGNHR